MIIIDIHSTQNPTLDAVAHTDIDVGDPKNSYW